MADDCEVGVGGFLHLRQLDDTGSNAVDFAAGIAGDIAATVIGARGKNLESS